MKLDPRSVRAMTERLDRLEMELARVRRALQKRREAFLRRGKKP